MRSSIAVQTDRVLVSPCGSSTVYNHVSLVLLWDHLHCFSTIHNDSSNIFLLKNRTHRRRSDRLSFESSSLRPPVTRLDNEHATLSCSIACVISRMTRCSCEQHGECDWIWKPHLMHTYGQPGRRLAHPISVLLVQWDLQYSFFHFRGDRDRIE